MEQPKNVVENLKLELKQVRREIHKEANRLSGLERSGQLCEYGVERARHKRYYPLKAKERKLVQRIGRS